MEMSEEERELLRRARELLDAGDEGGWKLVDQWRVLRKERIGPAAHDVRLDDRSEARFIRRELTAALDAGDTQRADILTRVLVRLLRSQGDS